MGKAKKIGIHAPLYTIRSIDDWYASLEDFLAQKDIPPGLPLFKLGIEVDRCLAITTSLSCCCETTDGYDIAHKAVLGSIRLLRSRLAVIGKIFTNGCSLCESSNADCLKKYSGPIFNVRDYCSTLEEYFSNSMFKNYFPLSAISTSIENCQGLLDTIIFLGDGESDYFAGGGGTMADNCLEVVSGQLGMVGKAIDLAQDHSLWLNREVANG